MRRTDLRVFIVSAIGTILLLGISTGSSQYSWPNAELDRLPLDSASAAPNSLENRTNIMIVAYGDTRTGVWGLGDNVHQRIHAKVVSEIICPGGKNRGSLDGVIFTGDAVMTNFPAWKDRYWRSFLKQTDRLGPKGASVPAKPSANQACTLEYASRFYPSYGNHETYKDVPLYLEAVNSNPGSSIASLLKSDESGSTVEEQVSAAYDAGEASYANQRSAVNFLSGDSKPYIRVELAALKAEMDSMATQPLETKKKTARNLGRWEGSVQYDFYASDPAERCDSDGNSLRDNYVIKGSYNYLDGLIIRNGKPRSYYSRQIDKSNLHLTLLALDTNCLDDPEQWHFFQTTVKLAPGPIIVFGHHPPTRSKEEDLNYDSYWPWDRVKGWEKETYRSYFESEKGKKIVLWIFGHVHNYQRHNAPPVGSDNVLSSPVVLVAGGGGATSLDKDVAPNQWFPANWSSLKESKYNYVLISADQNRFDVSVFGASSRNAAFRQIDKFSVLVPNP
jgi:hypothetical protein